MIKTFHAKNYGCLKDVTVGLTPLHAFIGPNDSGKSTILRGIRTVVQFAGGKFERREDKWLPFDPMLPSEFVKAEAMGKAARATLACDVEGGHYRVRSMDPESGTPHVNERGSQLFFELDRGLGQERSWDASSVYWDNVFEDQRKILDQLRTARLIHFGASALREPSGLIPFGTSAGFLDERGYGLPGVYQAIIGRGDDAWANIRASVEKLFPTIKRIGVLPISPTRLELEVELKSGMKLRANQISEGLLYYLAFAAIPYLEPVSVILVEEPENGLHPARIAEIVRILRAIVDESGVQVLMATHSPLVINELNPDEVSVVTRPSLEEGTKVTPIKDTPNFEKRSSVYALGELWLAYADGNVEAPLFEAAAR
ncbi:ATP-binding protein [Polyangium sp. 15x6]|uniref:AAA family ATPase n=1 Tax=Polyangium sp. 15x6 TaxID=3042687 RepID=UPI00249CB650|nr:ATP-binding protein [Polyangium sp. 15x6]MDI3283806.1 ATP-binding protein [Polyangium sp. 15x6]